MEFPKLLLGAYAVVAVLIVVLLGPRLAEEIFPSSASTQFRLRIDAPDGTRVAVTEALVQKVLAAITREAGASNLDLTLGYVGAQPSSYPINTVFLVDQRASTSHHEHWPETRGEDFAAQPRREP